MAQVKVMKNQTEEEEKPGESGEVRCFSAPLRDFSAGLKLRETRRSTADSLSGHRAPLPAPSGLISATSPSFLLRFSGDSSCRPVTELTS